MLHRPFYDPKKTYQANFNSGPFGAFADNKAFINRGQPRHEFLGQKVYLPFGIPAGPLINGHFVTAAFKQGFDIATYKTVRTRAYPCHPYPNVLGVKIIGDLTLKQAQGQVIAINHYSEPLSITNSFGVPSPDPDWWQKDMARAVKSAGNGQVMIASFQGTPGTGSTRDFINDHVTAAKLVKATGAKVIEINLSCPNEGTSHLLCFDIARATKITQAVKHAIGDIPLILKLAYFEDNQLLQQLVNGVGPIIEGLSVINTIPATIVDSHSHQALPGKGRERSGVCGAAIKWAGLDMVKRLHQFRKKFHLHYAIIGVGGVTTPRNYHQYVRAGADAVMSATGAMWNPYLAQQIKPVSPATINS